MSRPPRVMSGTGLYHIIFRGINHINIFEENEDYKKMLDIIMVMKERHNIEIYAYCLMTNHVHLFLKEKEMGDIKSVMHRLLTTYVVWFNRKYQRSGSLIGNRYKSEPIEDDSYCLALVRYIHNNPMRARICKDVTEYKWSSYNDYISERRSITNTNFILEMFSGKNDVISSFKEFHTLDDEEDFSISNTKKLTTAQIKRKITVLAKMSPESIIQLPRAERNRILKLLRENGLTIGQLERTTGISRGIITNAK